MDASLYRIKYATNGIILIFMYNFIIDVIKVINDSSEDLGMYRSDAGGVRWFCESQNLNYACPNFPDNGNVMKELCGGEESSKFVKQS